MNLSQRTPRQILRLSACVIALVALAGCGDGGSDVATDAPTTPSSATSSPSASTPESSEQTESPSPSESPTPEQSRLIDYADGESAGVEVHGPADVQKLDGAPAAFKQFIARTAEQVVSTATCDDAAVGVTVATLRTDGFAVGGVNECGGYIAMWAVVDGKWKEIQGTQDFWECGILERYSVPDDVAGTSCYDDKAGEVLDYAQA